MTVSGGIGHLAFAASGPNAAPAVTELLAQKIPTSRRSPTSFYKSEAFGSLAPGGLEFVLTLPPGHYACAYRFVDDQTGQMTELVKTGVAEAGE